MKVVVTGGAGFIGSNAIKYLHRYGYDVQVIDCFTYAGDFSAVPEYIKLVWGDIALMDWARYLDTEKPDVIVNYAAMTHVDRSLQDSEAKSFLKSNITGVWRLVSEIRAYQQRSGNKIFLVHISTDEVLGDLPVDSTVAYSEEQQLQPNNFYAATKASAELIIQAISHSFKDVDYAICRATNNYGPGQNKEKFLPTIVTSVIEKKKIPIYGDGSNIREWLWVDDFNCGVEHVIQKYFSHSRNAVLGQTFHFGDKGNRVANIEIVKQVINLMGASEELISFVPDRPGHDRKYSLDATKSLLLLDWKPRMNLTDGLKIVIDDMKSRNRSGLL